MKTSASLSSLGIRSFFVSPSEAAHGDLGRLSPGDVILCFSNSGETPEILRILPFLEKLKVLIIAITRSANTTLGRAAKVCLSIGALPEAAPLHIAPTTSTTAMLTLGDALAVASGVQRNFCLEEYGALHPGGDIGRSLLKVEEVMRSGNEHCVVPERSITKDVIHAYTGVLGRPGAATLIDDRRTVVGIFTDGNLRRLLDSGMDFLSQPISEIMTRHPITVTVGTLAREALHLLSKHEIDQIIVVDSLNRPLGLIDIQDLVRIFSSGSMV